MDKKNKTYTPTQEQSPTQKSVFHPISTKQIDWGLGNDTMVITKNNRKS